MVNLPMINRFKKSWQWIMYFLFAVFFFFVIWHFYDPHLLYLNLQPFFAFDSAFYDYHFQFKQAYLSLISQFFLQYLYYPVAGSLILLVLLLLLAFVFRKIFRKTISAGFEGIEFIVPLFILWQIKNYTTGLETLVVLFFAGFIFLGSGSLKQNFYLRAIFQLVTIYLVYTIFGIPVAIVLVLLYSTDELINEKNVYSILLTLADLALFCILSIAIPGSKLFTIQLEQLSFSNPDVSFPGFWYICIIIVFAFLLYHLPLKSFTKLIKGKREHLLISLFFPFFLLLCCSIGFKTLFINKEKYKAEIDFFITKKEWDKVQSMKNKPGSQDRFARFQMNRALYNTGQMSENLFSIPQEWGEYSLLLTKEFSMACTPYSSDLFFEFGYIKAAQYWMIEYQTFAPYSPRSLQRLAISSLLLGEFSIAEKYFTILSKSIIYRDSAKTSLKRMRKEPYKLMAEYTPENVAIIKEDNVINIREPDSDLLNILKVSRKNKVVFEYLMSYYILRIDLDNFYRFLPLVKSSGYYTKMPKTYEEVLIMYYYENKRAANTWEYAISRNTFERYQEFKRIVAANSTDKVKMKEMLKPMFKNTFWYYVYFDNPKTKGNKLIFK